jgi:hypothetical protein
MKEDTQQTRRLSVHTHPDGPDVFLVMMDSYGNPVSGSVVTMAVATGPGSFASESATSVTTGAWNSSRFFAHAAVEAED